MGVRNSRYNSRYKSRRESTLAGRLIIAAAVIILVAVLVYALWHLLARRSAGELYLEAEKKSFSKLVDNIEEKYISFKDKYKPYMEGPYSSRTEISLDVPGGLGSFGLQNTDAVKGILDKSKLIINTKNDPLKGISASEADLLIERSPFLNAQLFSDSQTIWLSIPDFLPDRYFSVRRDDLGGLYERFSIPVRPLKLISGREIAANLAFGGEDFRRSAEKPAEIYSEYLTNETVADNGEKAVKIGDLVTEGREMLVTLDEEKATSLLKGLLTTIADDDALLLYTYGNFAGISELLDDAGLFRLFSYLDETGKITLSSYEKEILAKLNVRKDMDGFRESLKKTAASYRLKDGIKMKVLLDRDGDIVYRDVSLDFAGTAGGVSFRADIAAGINTAGHRILKLVLTEYGTDGANDTTGDTSDAAVDTNVAAGDINRVTELFIGSGVEETKDPAKEGNIAVICTVTDGGKKSGINISIDTSDAIDETKQQHQGKSGHHRVLRRRQHKRRHRPHILEQQKAEQVQQHY
jgi:hypothetical protein